MPYRSWKFRIDDIIEAIDKIERYTRGIDFDEWQQDEKTVDAVIRNIEVIGEASSHLPIEIQEQYKGQWCYVVDLENYVFIVPYVESEESIFLKTIFPSRKYTKRYLYRRIKNESV